MHINGLAKKNYGASGNPASEAGGGAEHEGLNWKLIEFQPYWVA